MKSKYMIGLLSFVILFGVLITAGYNITYRMSLDRQASTGQKNTDARSVETDVKQVENKGTEEMEGYYLCELHGFVVVYLSDRTTVYEMTEIPVSELPAEVQQEIRTGKYMKDKEALYGFLENYSS